MKTRTTLTACMIGMLGMVAHASCTPTDPSAQSSNIDEGDATCRPPRILFVVDASGSMLEPIAAGDEAGTQVSKWEALSGAVEALTTAHRGSALYGLMTFPGATGGCTPGEVKVDIAAHSEDAINASIDAMTITADAATPAGQTLMAASKNEALLDSNYDNYVVFISDGWQYCSISGAEGPACAAQGDCEAMGLEQCNSCNSCQMGDTAPECSGKNADGCYCVRNWPALGVQALKDAGVKTYVVGFGENVDALTLNQAAHIGGDPLPNCDPNSQDPSCYLRATSPTELTAALDKIMLRVSEREPCEGACGITGKRKCSLEGWSECLAPDTVECSNECGGGKAQCVDGELGPCSSTCGDEGGSGGDGGNSTTGAGGSEGGNSGTGGNSSTTATTTTTTGTGGAGGEEPSSGGYEPPTEGEDPWYEDEWEEDETAPPAGGPPQTPGEESSCAHAPARNTSAWPLFGALALALAAARRRRR